MAPLAMALLAVTGGSAIGQLPPGDVQVNQDTTGNFQTEVGIVVDPLDPRHLVASWADFSFPRPDRLLQGPDPGIGVSFDGGTTWQSRVLFFPELCYAPDPVLTVDGQGAFFFGFLAIPGDCDFANGRFWVAKSTDGGLTTAAPVDVGSFTDKSSIFSDPASGAVYVIGSGIIGRQPRSPIFSKSVDGGATFSPALWIAARRSQGGAPTGAVGPNGEIYLVWVRSEANGGGTIYFDRSVDGGNTWLRRDVVVATPNLTRLSSANFPTFSIPIVVVDRSNGPHRGRIHVVWADDQFGDLDIFLSRSDDLGATWSTAIRVNDDAVGNGADQFYPWPAVDESGAVYVSFIDRRGDPSGLLFAEFLALSTNGGVTFGPNVRASDGQFGTGSAPFVDYDFTGLAVAGGQAHPIWADGRNDNMDIFTHAMDTADFDADGVLNDGDLDGQYADHPCTGGAVSSCDDNCPGTANPDQVDGDGDGIGDSCDT